MKCGNFFVVVEKEGDRDTIYFNIILLNRGNNDFPRICISCGIVKVSWKEYNLITQFIMLIQ